MRLLRLHRWIFAAVCALLRACMAAFPLATRPEGLRMGGEFVHAKACACLLACLLLAAGSAPAATPPDTPISNTASVSFTVTGVPVTVAGSVTLVTSPGTPASVEFLSYVAAGEALPPGAARASSVPATQCRKADGSFTVLPAPSVPGAGTLAVPGTQTLAHAAMYARGDVVFISVTDLDQNRNAAVAETVDVTLASSRGDREVLRLMETGPSTGVFLGYIGTSTGAMQAGNCVLDVAGNQRITGTYVDASEHQASISAGALIDPFGLVFDASTGKPVNGARVTVIDTATNQPARVLGNDGVSSYPSTVVAGSTVTDAGGTQYTFEEGRYQFPRLAPGTYRFKVEAPAGFRFPSASADGAIKALPAGPFALEKGSRGEPFVLVPGPALEIDLPLDPGPVGDLNLLKSAGKATAAIGDFVPYTISIGNRGDEAVPAVVIADRLPPGFRYQKGSARLDNAPLPEPQVSADGRSLQFAVGTIAGGGSATLRYMTVIAPGTPQGKAENSAQAAGRVKSNLAKATLLVQDDLNASRALLVGRVSVAESCDGEPTAARGLKDVRVLLQDGTSIVTDADGQWHADNLRPGTHVVQLDTTTLPQGMELKNCESSARTGGRDFSQFVNLRGGTLWRADFRLVRKESCLAQQFTRREQRVELRFGAPVATDSASLTLMLPQGSRIVPASVTLDGKAFTGLEPGDGYAVLRLPAQPAHWRHGLAFELEGGAGAELKAAVRLQPRGQAAVSVAPLVLDGRAGEAQQCAPIAAGGAGSPVAAPQAPAANAPAAPLVLVEQLPYDDKWLAAAEAGNEWLHPQTGFVPALPVIKVAVKHARGTEVELKVNGAQVDPLRYEGTIMSPTGEWLLSNWRSVSLRDGPNLLSVALRDAQGRIVLQETRTIHHSVAPTRALLDAGRSQLVADGRTPPVIAVRMLDVNGQPVRRGLVGEFEVNAPYLSQQRAAAIQHDPLTGTIGGRAKFEVGADGIALVPLQPTTQSGEVVLRFNFGENRVQEVRAWLAAELREWVLVGFAEGTLGHKRLAGNMEALQAAGADDQLFDQDRLAFYAKGRVRGDFLLTLAYDSAKERGTGLNPALKQLVDPTRFYTLYGDASQPAFDAASTRKLYLKIEKQHFYALFGDFDTGLSVMELGRYSRTLTGLKSEYRGEQFSYNAFAARSSQGFRRDDLQGDGTSGLYRLRGRNILLNSDKIRIEVRDRFHPERVLSSRLLTGYLDYQLDPVAGTLFFREPVASRDAALNPVFIVAEYETEEEGGAGLSYGGRGAVKLGERSEVGATRIHEGTVGREGSLTAVDATVQLSDTTRIRAEAASSRANTAEGPQAGQAYLAEVTHDDGKLAARAHIKQQDPGFGLGQQSAASRGERSAGVEARLKVSDQLQVQGQVVREQHLDTGARRELAEARVDWNSMTGLALNAGARVVTETDDAGVRKDAHQVVAGAAYEMLDQRMVLRASTEIDVGGGSGTTSYPNRLLLGADYRLTPETTVFAEQEFARGPTLQADTTRVGLRSQLWTGAEARVGMGQQGAADANRLYSSMGLVQRVKIDQHWSADAGIDRVQTLRAPANALGPNQPLPSGTPASASYGIVTGDYTAVSLGLAYLDAQWSANARAEWRGSDTDTRVNVLLGAQRKLGQGRSVAAALTYLGQSGTTDNRHVTGQLSYAFRPAASDWTWLERVRYVEESSTSLASRLLTRKLISNFNANWKAGRRSQVAFQYSAKYVREMLGDVSHGGFSHLGGIEARHDLGERWDVGVSASVLDSRALHARSYQLGMSVGYRLTDNTWVAIGYNHLGFSDADFAGAEYRAKGLYVSLRMKFDQDTFDLNDRAKGPLSLKP